MTRNKDEEKLRVLSRFFAVFAFPLLGVMAIGLMVLTSVVYQPAAAKTGYLLIWLNHKVYVMDIDTQDIYPVGAAPREEAIAPSPGCFGQVKAPCWVVIEDKVYLIGSLGEPSISHNLLLPEHVLVNSAVSWSPDGLHVAYNSLNIWSRQIELNLYQPMTDDHEVISQAENDPTIAVAWSHGCAAGLGTTCEIGYKTIVTSTGITRTTVDGELGNTIVVTQSEKFPTLVAYNLATHNRQEWQISAEPIVELRWSPDNRLFYSRPSRHFYAAESHEPAYSLPNGATIANVSPDMREMIYYQTFTLSDCQDANRKCLYLGLWLVKYGQNGSTQRQLIYNADLVEPVKGLNYIPTWSYLTQDLVFFQEGNLVYYSHEKNEAAIWHKSLLGKLRSSPIFAPNRQAVAFVDNQGNGASAYRLMIINPWLQPIEKFIVAENGFQILAWLPF